MPNLTTIAKWAATLGISRQQGYEAIKRCQIPVQDGKVDVDYATHLYHANTRKRAGGPASSALPAGAAPGPAGAEDVHEPKKIPGYETSRARREAAEAHIAEMKEAELQGKFLVKADVSRELFEVARGLRDGLANCARRIAADVAPLTTAEECEAVIEREHRALLTSMTSAFRAMAGVSNDQQAEAEVTEGCPV